MQKLPHRLLLVALPPGQLLSEGQGVGQEPWSVPGSLGKGRVSNLACNFLSLVGTWRCPSYGPSSAIKRVKWHAPVSPCLSFPKVGS